jgi:hypothetical protein
MAGQERLWVIGVGGPAAVQAFYYIENHNGEKVMPVFTTPELLVDHVRRHLASDPKAHMDMMEGNPEEVIWELTGGRFSAVLLGVHTVAEVSITMGADYLVRDLRPGAPQETMRVPK